MTIEELIGRLDRWDCDEPITVIIYNSMGKILDTLKVKMLSDLGFWAEKKVIKWSVNKSCALTVDLGINIMVY